MGLRCCLSYLGLKRPYLRPAEDEAFQAILIARHYDCATPECNPVTKWWMKMGDNLRWM